LVGLTPGQRQYPKLKVKDLKTFVFDDGEDAEEAFAASEVVVPDGRVVLLASRIENVNLNSYFILLIFIYLANLYFSKTT
jgi:hypothetical protein